MISHSLAAGIATWNAHYGILIYCCKNSKCQIAHKYKKRIEYKKDSFFFFFFLIRYLFNRTNGTKHTRTHTHAFFSLKFLFLENIELLFSQMKIYRPFRADYTIV